MKFNYIVGNPPYLKGLHLKISVKVFGILKDNGQFIFVQPATAFYNKNKPNEPQGNYIDIIKHHKTESKIIGGEIFNARFWSDLAVTKITKKLSDNTIQKITYKNGEVYRDVDLWDISMTQIPPVIYAGIRSKIEKYLKSTENLSSMISIGGTGISISDLRGDFSQRFGFIMSNFYSFYSPPNYKENHGTYKDNLIILCSKDKAENVYDYLELKFPQICQSIYKYSAQTTSFKNVPVVDFSRTYTDDELFEMVGFTKMEIINIQAAIPDYSARSKQKMTAHQFKPKENNEV